MSLELDFSKKPQSKCRHCGKERGYHKATTLHCPTGMRHRVLNYCRFHSTQTYEPKKP